MEDNIKNLNKLLCNLEVMAIKLQNYHWNIEGEEFFVVHEKLEEYYEEFREQIDEIAEHILTKGHRPFGNMKDFILNASIQEAISEGITSKEAFTNIINDIKILQQEITKIKQEAEQQQDYETSSIMDDYLCNYAKKIWMLQENVKIV